MISDIYNYKQLAINDKHNWNKSPTHQKHGLKSDFNSKSELQSVCWITTSKLYSQVTWPASRTSEVQTHICLLVCGAPWWVLLQHSIMLWLFFIIECGIVNLSPLCVYSKFRHPLGYLCAKFGFSCGLHCSASPWRKITITHPAYLMPQEPKCLRFRIINRVLYNCNQNEIQQ